MTKKLEKIEKGFSMSVGFGEEGFEDVEGESV